MKKDDLFTNDCEIETVNKKIINFIFSVNKAYIHIRNEP